MKLYVRSLHCNAAAAAAAGLTAETHIVPYAKTIPFCIIVVVVQSERRNFTRNVLRQFWLI